MTPATYALLLFTVAAIAHGVLFILLLLSGRYNTFKLALLGLCGITAGASAGIATGLDTVLGPSGAASELAITGSWCAFAIYVLAKQRSAKGYLLLSSMAALACVAIVGFALFQDASGDPGYIAHHATLALYARLGLAVVGLLAAENLYRNTASESRWHINLLCVALAGIFIYTILMYADGLLFGRMSGLLWAGRGIVIAVSAPLLAVTAARNRSWAIDIHVSRDAVFHTATLVGSGIFLLALAATGEVLRTIGAGWGELAEISLILAGITSVGVLATSGSARSRLRRLLVDNFYTSRYDYRQQWLKSIDILSAELRSDSVQTRVIKAVAEIVDSPAGVLCVRDRDGATFNWAGSWNQPAIGFSEAAESSFIAMFRGGDWVVEVEHCQARPAWLAEIAEAWLAVPLPGSGRLIGFIVLAQPRAPFRLDRETFDLLRIVARHAAIHIAEEQNARALAESTELREFGKRFAFVAHDLKNVTSQLSMILQNAASHRHDPEFHEDVLATVGTALDRINKLLVNLRSRRQEHEDRLIVPIDLLREQVAAICRVHGPQTIDLECDGDSAAVAMDPGAFQSVLAHICDNAIQASPGHVRIQVRHERTRVQIEVADQGNGMSAEFIRDRLFQPFGSTKKNGMGIGAYQARELVRAAGGDLIVSSRVGAGTRMRISLPRTGEAGNRNRQIAASVEGGVR